MASGGIPVQYLVPERYVESKVPRCADHPDARLSLFELLFREDDDSVECPVCGKSMEWVPHVIDAWSLRLEPGMTQGPVGFED